MNYLTFKKWLTLALFLIPAFSVTMIKFASDETAPGFELNNAVRGNNIAEVKKLLNQGDKAVINERDYLFGASTNNQPFTQLTPLMWAAYNGNKKLVEILLNAGADPSLKSKEGLTAAQIASARGYSNISEFIKEKGIVPSLYTLTRRKVMETPGGKEAIQEIKQGLPEHSPFEKLSPEIKEQIIFNLTKAKTVREGIENVRNFILSHPNFIDFAYDSEFTGRLIKFILQNAHIAYTNEEAMGVATLLGTAGAVNWLKEQFNDDTKRKEGELLLKKYVNLTGRFCSSIITKQEDQINLMRIRILLKAGINPDAITFQFNIILLMWAAYANKLEIVELLLEYGADPCKINFYGMSALDYAKKYQATTSEEKANQKTIINLLESAMQKCKTNELKK